MIKPGKTFISTIALVAAVFVGTGDARADDAVLFKIANIKPVKNAEGTTVSCDFETIFYNRSPMKIASATVDLAWKDETVGDLINEEKKAVPNDRVSRRIGAGRSVTEEVSTTDLSYTVQVPSMISYQQVMVKANVPTDRCFLLTEEPAVNIPVCETAEEKGACAGMFKAVSSKDVQYYREFKRVSYEEQKEVEKSRQEQIRDELNTEYNKVVSSMEEASRILTTIR